MKRKPIRIGKGQRTPLALCLNCRAPLDGATSVREDGKDERAKPGAICVCLYCGHIMALDADMQFRELTSSEMREIAGDPVILAIQKARGRTMNRDCTKPEREKLGERTCPDCGHRYFKRGPQGGLAINIECCGCKSRFNVSIWHGKLVFAQRIERNGEWPDRGPWLGN